MYDGKSGNCRNRILIVLFSIFVVSLPSLGSADRALVIGVDSYSRDSQIPPLEGAVGDAERMAAYLREYAGYSADQVLVLTNEAATRSAILSGFNDWLIAGTQPGDRIAIFFAGHGSHVPSLTSPSQRDQVLVPVDSYFDNNAALQNFIRDKELAALLDQLQDRQVTVIVDSCYSGEITRSAIAPESTSRMRTFPQPALPAAGGQSRSIGAPAPGSVLVESRPGLTVWSAASATQPAWETLRDGTMAGVFTTAFLDGLSDAAGLHSTTTHLELHNWVLSESQQACGAISACLSLTPTLEVARSLQITPVTASLLGQTAPALPETTELAVTALAPPSVSDPLSGQAIVQSEQVKLRIEPEGALIKGNPVHFSVEASFDGYLTLFDINPRGELTQLFPNRFSAAAADIYGADGDRVVSNRPIRLPDTTYGFEFTVQEPLGRGTLVAIVTADRIDLSDLVSVSRSLIVNGPDMSADILLRLRERLRQPVVDADGIERQPRYSLGSLAYQTRRH